MLLIEGLPIFLLELAIGQRLRKGSIGAWSRISPFLGGKFRLFQINCKVINENFMNRTQI